MSPNENQLRAALRDGEGDPVDAGAVIARALRQHADRHARRVKIASVAAVVAVVAGVGVAGGIVLNNRSGHSASAASGQTVPAAVPEHDAAAGAANSPAAGDSAGSSADSSAGGGAGASIPAAPGPLRDAALISCPAALPVLSAPVSGPGSLFSGPVEAIKVCAYATTDRAPIVTSNGTTLSMIYTGAQATGIAASIDAARATPPTGMCAMYRVADTSTIVIIGVTATGTAMAPITYEVRQNPCDLKITNGTAVRYDWAPPTAMANVLSALSRPGEVVAPSGPRANGSPITR